MKKGERVQVLDVRSPDEWDGGHIPNALHVFLGELREHLGKLDSSKPTAVYCDSGYREWGNTPFPAFVRAATIKQTNTNPMNKNPLSKGMIEENSTGIGEISGEMVAERAKELALIAGRPVNREHTEQAIRELTGDDGMESNQALLESFSEEERWAPIPSSTGHQAEESASETEDEEGQGRNAQLVEEGVREAAHDQMLQAALATKKDDLSGH